MPLTKSNNAAYKQNASNYLAPSGSLKVTFRVMLSSFPTHVSRQR